MAAGVLEDVTLLKHVTQRVLLICLVFKCFLKEEQENWSFLYRRNARLKVLELGCSFT
jgi:hypothetical protein